MGDSFLDERLVQKAKKDKISMYYDRFEAQQPQCKFGFDGVCCKNCFAGPCRIIPGKAEKGICGADASVIGLRNLLRHAASGASAHGDHAREVVLAMLKIVENKTHAYHIEDEEKLKIIIKKLGKKNAKEVALEALEDFRRQEGLFHKSEGEFMNWVRINNTKERLDFWKKNNLLPINIDLETSHVLHQTTMGNDADPNSLLKSCLRIGVLDGAAMRIATDFQDIIFGTPEIVKSDCNLGVMDSEYVNIAVHGHVPLLADKVVEWSKKLEKEAKKIGAKGINVIGICCSGHEEMMRHGVHLAAHVLQAEHAIVTGALDAMVVDAQCIYPSLQDVASCYHTKLITTMLAKIPGALHIPFTVDNADIDARKIVMVGVNNYRKRRKGAVFIPKTKTELYGGFSFEAIVSAVKDFKELDKLNGIVAVVGCRNPRLRGYKFTEEMIKILLKNDILVVSTGCIAHAAAQEGLMNPSALKYCGPKLKEFCLKIGKANGLEALPPVLHMGSCVDNSRIGQFLNAWSEYKKKPISMLPVAASAPEMMTEKSLAIGFWSLALGIDTHFNPTFPGFDRFKNYKGCGNVLKGETPSDAANVLIKSLKKKV